MYSVRNALKILRQDGIKKLLRRARNHAGTQFINMLEGTKEGISVMDEDWDNLIILDACRYDVFKQVNTLPGRLERRNSMGSVTWEFLRENFEGREFYDTVYVAGNAVVGDTSDALNVNELVGVWNGQDSPDNHPEIVYPEELVERTLECHHANPNKRLVAHFLQPHEPFLVKDDEKIPPDSKFREFSAARTGEVTDTEMRAVYEANLKYVLKHVAELIKKLDGKTVVTADHGELLGEGVPTIYELLHPRWPISKRRNFDYGHYSHIRVPELVEVPWLVIDSDKRREIIEADETSHSETAPKTTVEHLEALGYKS